MFKKRNLLLMLFLALASSTLLAQNLSLVEEALMDEADAYFQHGNFDLALSYYQRLMVNTRDPFIQTMIQKKMEEIQSKNKKVVYSPHRITFDQYVFYDSNVLKSGPDSQASSSEKAAPGTITNFRENYFKEMDKYLALQHNFYASYTRYTEQNNSAIFQNDSLQAGLSESFIWRHLFLNKKAQSRSEFYGDYSREDYLAQKKLLYFSRDFGVNMTEMVEVSNNNQFYFGFKFQNYKNYITDSDMNIVTPTLAYSYTDNKGKQFYHALEYQNQLAKIKANSTRILQYQLQMTITGGRWRLAPYFIFQFQDTQEQKDIRGYETLLNPGFSFDRGFFERWSFVSNIFYRKKTSKEKTSYTYNEYVAQAGVSYAF